MPDIQQATFGEPPREADAAVRKPYARYVTALRNYAEQFCPDRASADDIARVIFIQAWCHLPQLVTEAREHLSPEHQQVLVEAFYRAATTATIARQSGIPTGPPRSRLPLRPARPTPTYTVLTARPPKGAPRRERQDISGSRPQEIIPEGDA